MNAEGFHLTFCNIIVPKHRAVCVLLEVRMDRLALKFHKTKDLKVSDEIHQLSRELIKLDAPWVFVVL